VSLEIDDIVSCSTQDTDDPNLILMSVGYKEPVIMRESAFGKPTLFMDVYYLDQSSLIIGVDIFDSHVLSRYLWHN
jgi:hypothetical protein